MWMSVRLGVDVAAVDGGSGQGEWRRQLTWTEKCVDIDLVSEMLKDNLKLIWESFLCYGEQVE
ncbi:hypothetical protein RJ639_042655 [Escallonia herrerae]|uniref:Uncharacterized protein n=1 Tax=Escallonia herrerae TaxID=1293975 RepID=A0AA88WG05_9ASTE|nr:hypothetical protein RJ639_042655 [Escallonia herrerae]